MHCNGRLWRVQKWTERRLSDDAFGKHASKWSEDVNYNTAYEPPPLRLPNTIHCIICTSKTCNKTETLIVWAVHNDLWPQRCCRTQTSIYLSLSQENLKIHNWCRRFFPHIGWQRIFLRNNAFTKLKAVVQCHIHGRNVSLFHRCHLRSDWHTHTDTHSLFCLLAAHSA